MAEIDWSWKLTEGYSRFLDGAGVELELREGPLAVELDTTPLGLAKRRRPLRLLFGVKHTLRGTSPGGRWLIRPETSVVARLFFPGNAFLGNFRVPRGHLAVQWDVEGRALGSWTGKPLHSLLLLEAGGRIKHSWVEVFEGPVQPEDALRRAWDNFVDPLDVGNFGEGLSRQVVRLSADGVLSLDLSMGWSLVQGWSLPSSRPLSLLRLGADLEAGSGLRFRLEEKGRFQVQVSRERGSLELTVRRNRDRAATYAFSAGLGLSRSVRVRRLGRLRPALAKALLDPVGDPLVQKVNRLVSKSLLKQVETSFRLELARSKGSSLLLKAKWDDPGTASFKNQYAVLLSGRIPADREGVRIRGVFERVRARHLTVQIHFLNWLGLARSTRKREYRRATLAPDGNLVVEKGLLLEKSRESWEQIQFLRLVLSEVATGETFVRWSFGRKGRMSPGRVRNLLRMALHAGIIQDFVIPEPLESPLAVDLQFATEFEREGLESVRKADPDQARMAIARSFELSDPDRYHPGSYRRDWIDRESVRELVALDPVHAHLPDRYPGSARTDFQRRQVVDTYRRVRHFLKVLTLWKEGASQEIAGLMPLGLDIPVFLFFHLLCPVTLRRSAGLLSGDLDETWGDLDLLSST